MKNKKKKKKKKRFGSVIGIAPTMQLAGGISMARQYGKMYASNGTAGLGYVWTTSQQRIAYRMIARHYLGNWYALGRRDGARRYTAIVEHEYRAGYDVCIMGSTAAEMQERVHTYIDSVIASWQIDEYARVYTPFS